MKEFKGTKKFPEYHGGYNYSIDLIFDNESVISIDRRSRYSGVLVCEREEMEANAKLISKSYNLFEALEHTLEVLYECDPPKHLHETYANLFANYNNLINELKL